MNKKILILEDDNNSALLYKAVLKDYSLSIVYNVIDALTLLEEDSYDLVIIDIFLRNSKFDGLKIIPFLNCPYIIVTALISADLSKFKNSIVLYKPVKINHFLKTINNIFNNEEFNISKN